MKIKMLILICAFTVLAQPCLSKTITQYDKYGRKVASYKQTSSGYVIQDKYNRTTGYARQTGNRVVEYNKYGKIMKTYKTD